MKVNTLSRVQRAFHSSADKLLATVVAIPKNKKISEQIADIMPHLRRKDLDYLAKLPQISNPVKKQLDILSILADVNDKKELNSYQDALEAVLAYCTLKMEPEVFNFANGAAHFLTSDKRVYPCHRERAEALETLANHYRNFMQHASEDGPAFYRNATAAIDTYHRAARSYDSARMKPEAKTMLKEEWLVAARAHLVLDPQREKHIRYRLELPAATP